MATFDRYIKSTRIAYAMAVQSLPRQWQAYDDFTAVEQFPVTNLSLRYMTLDDIPQVVEIDRLSFDTPWSARSYAYEIEESHYSHMLVLEADVVRPASGWKKLLRSFSGTNNNLAVEKTIVGYGGLWNIMDEAHVSTIASHPDYRGKKYGEIVLAGMIGRAIMLGADYIVLEVRVSNTVARKLYEKYGFTIEAVKPKYYHHDNEDAYDMRLMLTDEAIAHFQKLYEKIAPRFRDWYTETPHPRLGR